MQNTLVGISILLLRGGCTTNPPNAEKTAMPLRERAEAFLERPIHEDLNYVPGSNSENFVTQYAEKGEVTLDPESNELLNICVMEGFNAAHEGSAERRAYFRESAEILEAILAESTQIPDE